jgi:membrane fusion protein (multidrug efflux system)
MMKKALIILVVFAIVGGIGYLVFQQVQNKIAQQKQQPAKTVFNVGVIKVHKTLLRETIHAQSILEGNPQVKVYPTNISGIFVKNNFREGDAVAKDADIAYVDRNMPGSYFLQAPVKSPIDGIITKLYFLDRGANVSPQQPMAEVANIASLKAVVNLGEADLLKVKNGEPVTVIPRFAKDMKINSKIDSVSPFIDSDTFSGAAVVVVDNARRRLKIGMSVDVEIEIGSRMAFVVPEKAVLMGPAKTFVFLNNNDAALELPVLIGYSRDGMVELTGNLKEGDEIITDGNFKLTDGARINVVR